jgi:hypothetical protein
VFVHRNFRVWWFAGLAVLALSAASHTLEHAEIALRADCVAHAHDHGHDHAHADTDHHEGGSRHDHGCLSHDHAPAVTGGIFVLTVSSTVSAICVEMIFPPSPQAVSIDHPPQLS